MNPVKHSRSKSLLAAAIALSLVMTTSYSLTEPANAPQTHDVIIFDLALQPQNVTIPHGDTISWLNNDPLIYTLWFIYAENQTTYEKAGNEGLSEPILPGESWSWTFDEPVTLQYYSFERLWITGFITVLASDVAMTNVTPHKTVVFQGYNVRINATVENQGYSTETNISVTAYANSTAIQTLTIPSLGPSQRTTLTFIWNTTGFAKGTYTIRAYAWPVPGEKDTADNNRIDGYVIVSMVGDLTGAAPFVPDGKVDGKDIAIVARLFGTRIGQPGYIPNADVNCDGKIDGKDIAIVARNFGKTDP